MQSPSPVLYDQTTSNVAEPYPVAAEPSALHARPFAPGEEILATLEGRLPSADPSERLPVGRKAPLKVPVSGRPGRMARFAREALKTVATLLILVLAVLAALVIWDSYVTAPWTRDGTVRVQVANIAPQVSGQITEVRVVDNQYVHQGDVLYVVDPFDFQVALDSDKAQLRQKAADVQVRQMQAERRQHLSNLATTPEEQQLYVATPSRRRRRSTPPSSRSRRPTSTSSGRRCAVP